MPPPDRSPADETPPEDDRTIGDERIVWRRLTPEQAPPDENRPGAFRLSQGGFDDSSDGTGMSVHLVGPDERPTEWLVRIGRPTDGTAVLGVRDIRAAGYGVVRRPEDNDPGHCEITGSIGKRAKRKALFRMATLIRDPG